MTVTKKEAKEKILLMAGLYGLTHNDLTSIGNRLRNQQIRNAQKSDSDQLLGYEHSYDEKTRTYTVKHNGSTVTATHDGRRSSSWNDQWKIKCVGPKGGIKMEHTMNLSNYEISRWPKKFYVNRDLVLTILIHKIHNKVIPT